MKTQWIKTTGMLMLAAIMVVGVNAQQRGGKGQGPGGQGQGGYGQGQGRMKHLSLDLTEEQQEQMKALKLENYKVMKPLKAEMAELKAKERTLMSVEQTDLKAVNQVIDDQTALMSKMRKLQVEHKVAGKNILTDEQLMKIDQKQQFSKKRMAHAKGARRGGGPNRY